ncbi:NADH:flavin oxidoreductase/NADH oxidase [Bradyrhizobium sp. LHD-71]|uniref:NADH:flavin oxidoreductase/NADH oxidase n=1 Tax=Bradyrhizobium sp. LHD-71 TaxID=3072141 RepID=UPI00280DB495|nr:NADH:flavin oxidoreductase/NADH oxidase [Bradyrhizobium sp. LHD-71]MDQ8729808.1 NADH:flavin oxidoreductase/NADH oxidase [Bradyrhizobium sp. LHD-71]
MSSPLLFTPIKLRELTARNRVVIAPMLQYSGRDGLPTDWHLLHLGKFALGGAGIVFSEAIAIEERGRITYGDLGLYRDDQVAPLRRITDLIKQHGAIPAVQLAHAGRKAGTQRPWDGHGPLSAADLVRGEPPWQPVGASAIAASPARTVPSEMSVYDIAEVLDAWRAAALRALDAGFQIAELHGAHGYLLHTFLSPESNRRTDRYGGSFEARARLPLEAAEIVRSVWPKEWPVFYRISAVDEGGWRVEDSVRFARALHERGIDVVDCSSGSLHDSSTANVRLKRGFGFQVPFAAEIRQAAKIKTMAVGLIVEPEQAESILQDGHADMVAIGREALYNPNWPLHAQVELSAQGEYEAWPVQHGWWLTRRERIFQRIMEEEGGVYRERPVRR